jgi:hypothetical protein
LADSQPFLRSNPPPPGKSGVLLLTAFQVQELCTEWESCKTTCSSEPQLCPVHQAGTQRSSSSKPGLNKLTSELSPSDSRISDRGKDKHNFVKHTTFHLSVINRQLIWILSFGKFPNCTHSF